VRVFLNDLIHIVSVVLIDLFLNVPMSLFEKDMSLAGQEMPLGIFLALLAVKNGAEFVAVFTDTLCDEHPASICLDVFSPRNVEPMPFSVRGSKVLLSNPGYWSEFFHREDPLAPLDSAHTYPDEEIVEARNWQALLKSLLNG